MGLKNISLLALATSNVPTGGTPLVFADDGITIQNGLHLIVPADADYQTRRQVTAKYRPPTLDPKTGVYGKDKKSLCLVQPILLPNGSVSFQTLRIEREVHPSLSMAQAAELCSLGAQLLTDNDVQSFWATGSLS